MERDRQLRSRTRRTSRSRSSSVSPVHVRRKSRDRHHRRHTRTRVAKRRTPSGSRKSRSRTRRKNRQHRGRSHKSSTRSSSCSSNYTIRSCSRDAEVRKNRHRRKRLRRSPELTNVSQCAGKGARLTGVSRRIEEHTKKDGHLRPEDPEHESNTPPPPLPTSAEIPRENISHNISVDFLETLNKTLQAIATVNPQVKNKYTSINVVPEFDPKVKNQTIVTWLNKVNECADIYGWDSKQTTHYALPKLVNTAKRWYEGQSSVMHSWDIWQEKLKAAFPTNENYAHLLTEMLNLKAKFGDDLEEYYYEKLIALNRCRISGKDAIDCIVYGIEDRSVRYGAEAVGFDNVDKLLGFLRNVKHERVDRNANKKIVKPVSDMSQRGSKGDVRVLRCFNCHEVGHMVSKCPKPIIKCQKCMRVGHDNPNCTREVRKDAEVKTL